MVGMIEEVRISNWQVEYYLELCIELQVTGSPMKTWSNNIHCQAKRMKSKTRKLELRSTLMGVRPYHGR